MKRFLLFVAIFLGLFILPVAKFAQEEIPSGNLLEDVKVECLKYNNKQMENREPDEVEKGGTITGNCPSSTGCYVVTGYNGKKTTGITKFDKELWNSDVIPAGVPTLKLKSGAEMLQQGNVNEPVILYGARDHTSYDVYAAYKPEPTGKGVEGRDATQQISDATLVFSDGSKRCNSIFWDPYGRVFDGVSLEPLGKDQATVTLLDEKGMRSNATLTNDVQTDELGKYNILVNADGFYKINVVPKTDHSFKAFTPDPIYSDLYSFVYMPGDPAFEEKAISPKRVDIALMPNGTPLTREPDYIYKEYTDVSINGESYTKISLRTIHPMTKVTMMVDGLQLTEDGTGELLSEYSDKEGIWLAVVKKELTSQNGFSIILSKDPKYYPLSTEPVSKALDWLMSLLARKVSAQQSIEINDDVTPEANKKVIEFSPILDYVEGFAYGEDGNPIVNAKVNVMLEMNKKIYFSTVADSTGFFAILPKNLPPFEFYLEYVDPVTQKSHTQTTAEFVKANSEYIDSEKMNLITATKYGQKIVNQETGEINEIVKDERLMITPTLPPQKEPVNISLLVTMFIVLLLIAGVAVTIFYMKKQQSA